jgi:parallel beta-helix repeat protein
MKGKLILVLCLLLLLSCLSYAAFSQIEPKASSSLPVHNLDTGLNYTTIQEAIDASETANGHTIKADAGTYYEHLLIDKSITLVGEDSNTTIIDGNETGTIIEIMTDHVSILDLTARNAGPNSYPLVYDACVNALDVHDIDVENSVFLNAGRGIAIGRSFSVNINNNTIMNMVSNGINARPYGIDVGDWQVPGVNRNITLSNNLIRYVNGSGINLDGDSENCTIANNTVEDCSRGIDLLPNIDTYIVPTNNLVDGNALANNTVNMIIMGALGHSQEYYTNTFRRNSLTNKQGSNLIVWGYELAAFMQDIDSSNVANGKEIDYLTNCSNSEIDLSNHLDAGYLTLVNCTNATVRDFDFVGNRDGLLLAGTTNCTLTNMTLGNDQPYVYGANASQPTYGLTFFESSNDTVENCKFCNDTCGIVLYHSARSLFRHNYFVNNYQSVFSESSTDVWDDGVEGNYWSDYNGTDLYSGPYQNQTGSDGIGDTPYVIDASNNDSRPLMGTFSSFGTQLGNVCTVSNSTISDFQFNGTAITFDAVGENGTTGFCRICIPTVLINGTCRVFVNGTEVPYTLLPESNSTQSYLYFTFHHSTQEVTIPEFPSFLILPLFLIATLLTAITYKKRPTRTT